MAPRVGFEPTTNRLTVDCSTTELPRNIPRAAAQAKRVSIKFGAKVKGQSAAQFRAVHGARKTRAPCGALEGVGYGGVSPREDTGEYDANR